jgi:hypothetical protein
MYYAEIRQQAYAAFFGASIRDVGHVRHLWLGPGNLLAKLRVIQFLKRRTVRPRQSIRKRIHAGS